MRCIRGAKFVYLLNFSTGKADFLKLSYRGSMRLSCFLLLFPFFLCMPLAWAGLDTITPSAPVKQFRFPKFGSEGYTQWVLKGGVGIYDGPEQIRVEAMGLRVYTGDARMALELSLDSPDAILRMEENRAVSEAPISIEGKNFTITGKGWDWNGTSKDINVLQESRVEFSQSIMGLSSETDETAIEETTLVQSEALNLKTTETDYTFKFTGGVIAESNTLRLESDRLDARAVTPEGSDASNLPVSGSLTGLKDLVAIGSVLVTEDNRQLKAERAEFYPSSDMLKLKGAVEVATSNALIYGDSILSQSGVVTIQGQKNGARAQMTLMQAGGLGLSGSTSLDEVTLIHADTIVMQERGEDTIYEFSGRVEIFSGMVTVRAEKLFVESSEDGTAKDSVSGDALAMGTVNVLRAEGNVYINDDGTIVQAGKATFYPERNLAKLSESPRLSKEGTVVSGARMELTSDKSYVFGTREEVVRVLLPELPDLGYESLEESSEATSVVSTNATRGANEPTIIQSQYLEMTNEESNELFIFKDSVEVFATNLEARCEYMEVSATNEAEISEEGELGAWRIESIDASDQVRIQQEGRTATADSASIEPLENRMVLTGNARVDDSRGKVRGERLILNQGESRAIIEGGNDGERATVILPALNQSKE